MTDLVIRLAYLLVGLGVGYVLGVVRNDAKHARRAAEENRLITIEVSREVHDVSREVHDVSDYIHDQLDEDHPANPPPLPEGGQAGLRGPAGKGLRGQRGEPGEPGEPGEDKDTPFMRVAMALILIVVAAYAAYFATKAQSQLDAGEAARTQLRADQATFDERVQCVYRLEADNILAQKARSVFALQQAQVSLHLLRAQEQLLDQRPGESAQESLMKYRSALHIARIATADQLRIAKDNPFPPLADIQKCEP